MFVALIISLNMFLVGPDSKGPSSVVDPGALVIQETSISGAPALVLAGFVYFMGRGYRSVNAGMILIGAGIVMIVGMAFASTMLPHIQAEYLTGGVDILPYVFITVGIAIAAMGFLLTVVSNRREARNLDDLR